MARSVVDFWLGKGENGGMIELKTKKTKASSSSRKSSIAKSVEVRLRGRL
jgi:hypothetical protein